VILEQHSLRKFFHQIVDSCYFRHLGMEDHEITSYNQKSYRQCLPNCGPGSLQVGQLHL
jgi:hypothetical protein